MNSAETTELHVNILIPLVYVLAAKSNISNDEINGTLKGAADALKMRHKENLEEHMKKYGGLGGDLAKLFTGGVDVDDLQKEYTTAIDTITNQHKQAIEKIRELLKNT